MHMDPLLPPLVAFAFGLVLVTLVARRLRQPYVIAYILAGVLLGPSGIELFDDPATVARLGEVGVVLLLFFIGLEVDLGELLRGWRVSVVATLLQVAISVACMAALGLWLEWSLGRIVLLGFAISLSSTALVVSVLRQRQEVHTRPGRDALGVLLVQDVLLVPMLIVIGLLGGERPAPHALALQIVGGATFVVLTLLLARGKLHLPLARTLRDDHELQVFVAFLLCLGLSWASAACGLSTALGAFFAGLLLSASRETAWVHRALEPFRVLFVAFFFVSVGMLLDLSFLDEHWEIVLTLTLAVLLTNTSINVGVLRFLGRDWRTSLYVGALLSQVGEFSFVLAAVGRQSGIISDFAHQAVIGTIAGSLVLTPPWIALSRRMQVE